MKTNKLLILFILNYILFSGCNNDFDISSPKNVSFPKNAKLKRISSIYLGFSKDEISYKPFVTNSKTTWYVSSNYEYDNLGRISKVSQPMYEDGIINGIISYSIYTYNAKNQLEKIDYYNANLYAGFLNLHSETYSYDEKGNRIKTLIEYPQINRMDSVLYFYENDRLVRENHYDSGVFFNGDTAYTGLITYIKYEYDHEGILIKETYYSGTDNNPYSFSLHSYQNRLNVKTEIFIFSNNQKVREIRRYYDDNDNLTYIESQELSLLSSALSYISKYEY